MKKLLVMLLVSSLIVTSCGKDDSKPSTEEQSISELVNTNFTVVGGTAIDPATLIETSNVEVTNTNNGRMPLVVGDQITTTINFTPAAQSNGEVVDAVGMRFGENGDIQFKNITPAEAAAGAANITFTIDPSVCDNIAQICHDLLCYEFAKTSAGTITAANFQDVALMCGACEEPSCQVFCCTDEGMSILNTNVTENNGAILTFNDCDMYVLDNKFSEFRIGISTILDDSFDPNARMFLFDTTRAEFIEGRVFSDFSIQYQDFVVERHKDDPIGGRYRASRYNGNDQGTIEIVTLREGLDQFGEERVLEFEVKFNNLKCANIDGVVKIYNGSMAGIKF